MSEIAYDAETALVVVDVQNDFASPDGNLYVTGGEKVVPIINAETERVRAAGGHAVYTADWHPEHTPHFAKDGGIWPDHCVAGTMGAEFHPDLVLDGPIVRKGVHGEDGYSGFTTRDPQTQETTPTELEGLLRERGIRRVVVCGLATDYCVVSTALDALTAGFSVDVRTDAIRAVDLAEGDGERALTQIEQAGGRLVAATGPAGA